MKKAKRVLFHVLILGIISFVFILKIPCPILFLFRVPCPTCGVTRALRSLLAFDFQSYIEYNFMALPLALIIVLYLHFSAAKKAKFLKVILYGILFINTVRYIQTIYKAPTKKLWFIVTNNLRWHKSQSATLLLIGSCFAFDFKYIKNKLKITFEKALKILAI